MGSLYSNFARLALQLQPPPSWAHLSFDAVWCPYHKCQAGCTDVDRLCHNPSFLVDSELSVGSRGNFAVPAAGEHPLITTDRH